VGPGNIPVTGFVPDNWAPGNMNTWPPTSPVYNVAATKALAKTNPNRPEVDVPVFLFELADFPKMIKELGDHLIKTALQKKRVPSIRDTAHSIASTNLSVQFGWLPLVSDIAKLLDFQKLFDRRVLELRRLYSSGGLRRRVNIWQDNMILQGSGPLQTSNFTASARYYIYASGECWATTRWRPDKNIVNALPVSDRELTTQALQSIAGLSFNLASAWEAIPFSWLIDYFANVGDVLNASRNHIPVSATEMCVMYKKDSSCLYSNVACSPSSLSGVGGYHTNVVKDRWVEANPVPQYSVTDSLLNPRQWSILASLFVTRFL
jgi:hypothetical protein